MPLEPPRSLRLRRLFYNKSVTTYPRSVPGTFLQSCVLQSTFLGSYYSIFIVRYANQKSLPIYLKKGEYYYMEAIMKDDHQPDHLEVALETPDGKFYKVIPSMFLWTTFRVTSGRYLYI